MRVLTILFLGLSLFARSQNVIVEEKFEKDNVPLNYELLPLQNKLAIKKGKVFGFSTNREVNKVTTYNSEGKDSICFDNKSLMDVYFNYSGNVIIAEDFSKMKLSGDNIHILGKFGDKILDPKKHQPFYVFDDQAIMRRKEKDKYNVVIPYKGNTPSKADLKFEGTERIVGENFYESQRVPGSKVFINEKGNLEAIYKSLTKDCKESIIYRTEYTPLGERIADIQYNLTLKDYSFILSVTGGGYMVLKSVGGFTNRFTNNAGFTSTVSLGSSTYSDFGDDGSINNLFFDNSGNVYVYGMLGKKEKKNLLYNRIVGYYIYKYNKEGSLIWEKKFETGDKLEKIGVAYLNNTYVRLFNTDGKLQFLFASTQPDEVLMLSDINEETGDFINSDFYSFKTNNSNDFTDFIIASITDKDNLKNKIIDYEGLMLYYKNKKFKDYIDSTVHKSKIYFNTLINKAGTWLIESDNKSYYKVIYFE
ncbi:hypothetical protein GOQ30_15360 [Flavobacterium sp. TP390]|uniref:Uncharacterized protein n=1 Tax=Flavobacterium profundi TaxID=1774945 RepID=A0A6I4IUN6_9FLAO|nr:hypothetical protein [Flavobacterium profundi]MVO10551.1 hypothetical protein [Flavobacterium profundi]